MQKRKLDSKQKLQIVLEGLNGRTVARMRTIKEELLWLNEWCGLEDMKPAITN